MTKTRLIQVVDGFLLLVCCVVVAGRCQIHEAFGVGLRMAGPLPEASIGYGEASTMVVLTGVIFLAAAVWLAVHFVLDSFNWRKIVVGIPALLIIIGGFIGIHSASNRHTAEISHLTLIGQLVLGILLIQLLNTKGKQRLLLCVIAATGVTFAYRCWEQYHYEIPETLKMYEQDPASVLARQQLEPGTYQAEQYIARMKSRDIGGYFAISNTAASFFILSSTATLALLLSVGKEGRQPVLWLVVGLAFLVQIAALVLTKSKGGIGAWTVSLILPAMLWGYRRYLQQHWRGALLFFVLFIFLVVIAITAYGLAFERLPSNSMWVRWQYWHATGEMIADHLFTGVGPGNFGTYYPRYMEAGAPEVVKDPHCFWLGLWSQWGLLGFVGFGWGLWRGICYLVRPISKTSGMQNIEHNTINGTSVPLVTRIGSGLIWGLPLVIGIQVIRVLTSDFTGLSGISFYSVLQILFLVPGLIWLVTFILLQLSLDRPGKTAAQEPSTGGIIVLGCGLLGFLLHNSIDMALFEPGVGTCFFALTALVITMRQQNENAEFLQVKIPRVLRQVIAVIPIFLVFLFIYRSVIPICLEQHHLRAAERYALKADSSDTNEETKTLLSSEKDTYYQISEENALEAVEIDLSNPEGHYFLSRLCFLRWAQENSEDQELLPRSISYLKSSVFLDKENYKYYRRLSEVYRAAFQRYPDNKDYLEKALIYTKQALERYPSKSELLIEQGQLLEYMNRPKEALAAYKKALTSEEAFLEQQRQMYPLQFEFTPRLRTGLRRWTEGRIRVLQKSIE